VAVVLALVSALMYGVSDFVGGRASRRVPPVAVALFAEAVMLPIALVAIPLIEGDGPTNRAMAWGLVAGFTGSVGVVGLYIALARGNMTVVAPTTGVVAAAVPVVVGLASGERPGPVALAGIALAIAAVALIGGITALATPGSHPAIHVGTVVLAVAVGVMFGMLFVSFQRAGDDAGMWPLLFSRFSGLPLLAATFVVRQRTSRSTVDRSIVLPGLAVGCLIIAANATYLLAARRGLLSVVAVVVAMYPASTVLLATIVDGERPTRPQVVGMVLAAAALLMITLG
jgi:drug/metabolite transporter (DMT)-like permease